MSRARSFVIVLAGAAAACSHSPDQGTVDACGAACTSIDSHFVDSPIPSGHVHARIGVLSVSKTGALNEVIDATEPSVALDDGTMVTVAHEDDGSIEFERPSVDVGYALTIGTLTVFGTTSDFSFLPPQFGHTAPAPVTMSTPLDVTLDDGGTSGGATVVFGQGPRDVLTAPSPYAFTADWMSATPFDGRPPQLLSVANDDVLWFLHETTSGSGASIIDATAQTQITQTNGSATAIDLTYAPLAPTGCENLAAPFANESARMTAATIGSGAVTASLEVASEPASTQVVGGELELAGVPIGSDAPVAIPLADPFTGEGVIAIFAAQRPVRHASGATSTTPLATDRTEVDLSSSTLDCNAAPLVTLPSGAGFAGQIKIANVSLVADDQPIAFGSGAPTVTITPDNGAADRYEVELFDVTTSTRVLLATLVSASATMPMPRSAFTNGHRYELQVTIGIGYPNVATGDLSATAFPFAETSVPSFTFEPQL